MILQIYLVLSQVYDITNLFGFELSNKRKILLVKSLSITSRFLFKTQLNDMQRGYLDVDK